MVVVPAGAAVQWCGVGDRGIMAARSRGELRCVPTSALQALAVPLWGLGWEVGPGHGWTVLNRGATFPNNLQKLL